MIKDITASWKTTVAGIMQFLALVFTQIQFLFDGVATTTPDWGLLVASLITLVGLITARDNGVSSEQAGIKKSKQALAPRSDLSDEAR